MLCNWPKEASKSVTSLTELISADNTVQFLSSAIVIDSSNICQQNAYDLFSYFYFSRQGSHIECSEFKLLCNALQLSPSAKKIKHIYMHLIIASAIFAKL